MSYPNDRLAPRRRNRSRFSFDSCKEEPATKVPCTRKRVRNRLQMKPDGSIVCETSEVVEEVDDKSNTGGFHTSLLDDERLIKLEQLEEDNEVDPLLPVEDPIDVPSSPTFIHVSNVSMPEMNVLQVKSEDKMKTEDGTDEIPTLLELTNPFSARKVKTELYCDNHYEPEDMPDASAIPIIDISEPIVPDDATTQSTSLTSRYQTTLPLVSQYLGSEKPFTDETQGVGKSPPADDLDTSCSTISARSPMFGDAPNQSDDEERQLPKPVQHPVKPVSNQIHGGFENGTRVDWRKTSSEPVVVGSMPKNTDSCPCIIETLLQVPFVNKQWTTDERKAIVMKGKPTQFPVRFTADVVIHSNKLVWLTGCTARDELHCWPCLLFQPKQLWFSVHSLLSDDALIHERAFAHKKSVSMLNKLEVHFQRVRLLKKKKRLVAGKSSRAEAAVSEEPSHVEDLTGDDNQQINTNYTCLIIKLIANDFSCFSQEERNSILLKGRPRPSFEELSMSNRNLSSDQEYDKIDWLTGSAELKKLFCWPCLLSSQKTGVWSKFGFSEFKFLADVVARHEITQSHMDAYLQLKVWESQVEKKKIGVDDLVQQKADERKHRDFLKYIIDVVCFMKKKVNNSAISIDDYVDVIKLVGSRDEKLKYFFKEKSLNSDEAIKSMITPYLESISTSLQSIMLSRIKDELKKSPFMALILDDTSIHDKMCSNYVAVIVRYTTEIGDPRERFVKFIKAATDRPILNLLEEVKSLINELGCAKKFVGFTYDGGVVQSSMVKFFNNELKQVFPFSNFFHYKEHSLRRLIRQSLTHLKCCRNFIIGLAEISSFFENTPNATFSFLSMNGYKQSIEWDFSSGLILTIKTNYCLMIQFFDKIRSNALSFEWNNKVISQADKFVKFLLRLPNRFLIILLSRIFSDVDHLSRVLQGKFDTVARVASCKNAIDKIKSNSFDDIFRTACSVSTTEPRIIIPVNHDTYKEIYQQVINDVSSLLYDRNSDLEKWELFNLTPGNDSCSRYMETARSRLASASFTISICSSLDCQRLLPQLVLICGNERFFGNKDINELIRCLHDFDMVDTVYELYKFLMFIRTIPMIANDSSTIPTIRKMAAYTKGRKDLDTTDTLMWMERDLLTALQSEVNFHDEVIDDVILEDIKNTALIC